MSPPTETDRIAALARLSGPTAATLPEEGLERDALALRLIEAALTLSVPWAVIGEAILPGLGPKLAKREAHRLAKSVAAGRRHVWPEQVPLG